MSEVSVTMFADTVSSTTVQLRQCPGKRGLNPVGEAGRELVQANLVLAGTATATFWAADCSMYDVIIRRRT